MTAWKPNRVTKTFIPNDAILVEDAAAAKLTVVGSLTDDETWVRLRPSE